MTDKLLQAGETFDLVKKWVQIRTSGVKNQNLQSGHWGCLSDNDHFLCQNEDLTSNTLQIENQMQESEGYSYLKKTDFQVQVWKGIRQQA